MPNPPTFGEVSAFQLALIEALGLKDHHVTRVAFEATHERLVRVQVEEVLTGDQLMRLQRVFELSAWQEAEVPFASKLAEHA